MKRFVLTALASVALFVAVSPASAQWEGRRHWHGRDRVIVQEAPGISGGTIAAIIALQALQAAQQPKETVVVRERTQEYRPLKQAIARTTRHFSGGR